MDQFISLIEARFFNNLCLDEKVPNTYLNESKIKFRQKLNELNSGLFQKVDDEKLVKIVHSTLFNFSNQSHQDKLVSFREIFYYNELVKEVEVLDNLEQGVPLNRALNDVLIYLNFNNRAYLHYFTQRIVEKVNGYENLSDKIDYLLYCLKDFNQMHRKPDVIFNPQYKDLKAELSNWFTQEIIYLEKKMHLAIVPLNGNAKQKDPITHQRKNEPQKVLSILSVDQMALILRATDDLKILMAKSLNAVFKSIVPYLSTPYKENISYDSMRSKSYAAESRDKEIVIQTLEQMIKKIREY